MQERSWLTLAEFPPALHNGQHSLRVRLLVASLQRGHVLPATRSRHIDIGQMFAGGDPPTAICVPKRTRLLGHLRQLLPCPEPLGGKVIPNGCALIDWRRKQIRRPDAGPFGEDITCCPIRRIELATRRRSVIVTRPANRVRTSQARNEL